MLEIGGTHVTAAVVRFTDCIHDGPCSHHGLETSITTRWRDPLPADGTAEDIGATIGDAVRQLGAGTARCRWGVAIPGPFDYERGIGRFQGVGKFSALYGRDVAALLARHAGIAQARFVNDADAFGLGEYLTGAGRGFDPSVYLTLGTGVGSTFIRAGECVHHGPDVPTDGHAFRIMINGEPLEERMSRRAIIADWLAQTGQQAEVAELAASAAAGDQRAEAVFARAFSALANGMLDYLRSFRARAVIIGGSVARSWWLIEKHLITALRASGSNIPVLPAARDEAAGLVGAASVILQSSQ